MQSSAPFGKPIISVISSCLLAFVSASVWVFTCVFDMGSGAHVLNLTVAVAIPRLLPVSSLCFDTDNGITHWSSNSLLHGNYFTSRGTLYESHPKVFRACSLDSGNRLTANCEIAYICKSVLPTLPTSTCNHPLDVVTRWHKILFKRFPSALTRKSCSIFEGGVNEPLA